MIGNNQQKSYLLSGVITLFILMLLFLIKIKEPKPKKTDWIPIQINFGNLVSSKGLDASPAENNLAEKVTVENSDNPEIAKQNPALAKQLNIDDKEIKKVKEVKPVHAINTPKKSKEKKEESSKNPLIKEKLKKVEVTSKTNIKSDKSTSQKNTNTTHQQAQKAIENLLKGKSSSSENNKSTENKSKKENTSTNNNSATGNQGQNYELSGRSAILKPKPDYTCNQSGKLVVDIWVNPKGEVTQAKIARGTTNNADCLTKAALEAAKKTKFTPLENAPEKQNGQIFYYFKLVN